MATNATGSTARRNEHQTVHSFRKTITYADANLATGVFVGYLPAGAMIESSAIDVSVGFNAGTTNPVTVGTNAGVYDNIVTAAQSVAQTQGVKRNLAPTLRVDQVTADIPVFITYIPTGTAASAGQLTVIIFYVPNNDL